MALNNIYDTLAPGEVSPVLADQYRQVQASRGIEEQPKEEEEDTSGIDWNLLYEEEFMPQKEEVPLPDKEDPARAYSPEPELEGPPDLTDIDIDPAEYDLLFQEEFVGMSKEQQQKYIDEVTPDEVGLTPLDYKELYDEMNPNDELKIDLDGLNVQSVFRDNPEWEESLKPGPDGLTYAADLGKGIAIGIREGLVTGGQWIAENIYGVDPGTMYAGELDFDTETQAGEISKNISRFLTGFTIYGAPLGGLGGAMGMSSVTSRYLMDGALRGAVGDFLVSNKNDQTLVGLLAPESDNPIIQFMRVDPEDSELSAKAAVVIDGVILGTAVQGLFDAGKWAFKAYQGGRLNELINEEMRLSDDLFDPNRPLRFTEQPSKYTAEIYQDLPSGQKIMDDIQTTKAAAQVDEKMRILKARQEQHEIREYRMDFKERNQVRTESRNLINVAENDLKGIEARIEQTRTEIEDLVKRQEGLWEQLGGIKGIIGDVPAERELAEKLDTIRKATKPGEVYEPVPRSVPGETLLPERPPVVEDWAPVYKSLTDQIQRKEKTLADLLNQHSDTTMGILENKQFIREIAEEVQLEAAVRKGLATRLDLTPRYSQVHLDEEVPVVLGLGPKELEKMRTKYRLDGSFTLLQSDAAKWKRVPKNSPREAAAKMNGKKGTGEVPGRTIETRPLPSTPHDAMVDDVFYKRRGTSIPESALNKIRGLGSGILYRSTDKLKSLAEVSPTAGKLANMFRHDAVHMGPEAGQYGYTETAQYMIGKYRTKVRDALAELGNEHKTYFGKLTEDANRHLYNYLNGVDIESVPVDIRRVGQKLRETLDDFHGQVDEPTPYVENFFPRYYNRRAMAKNDTEFRALLARDGYVDKARQDSIIKKIANEEEADLNIGAIVTGEKQFAMRGSKILSGGRRTLNLSVQNYGKFIDQDVSRVLDEYITRGSPKIAYSQLFGYGGEKVKKMLADIEQESIKAGRPIRADETAAIAKMLQNIQGLRKFDTKAFNVAQESIATAMRVTLLHLATLASLGEAFIPFSKASLKDSAGGLLQAMAAVPKHYFGKVLRNVPEARAYEAAQAVGLATDFASSTRINNILGGGEIMTGINRKVNNAFFLTNLLSEWVKFVQVSAFHTGRLKAINNLKSIEKGGMKSAANKLRARELREMGISVDEGLAWLKRGANQKDPFYVQIQRGALRFVDDTIIHPDATVKPGIQNSPEAMLLTQLKAYPTGFANIVLRDWGEGILRPMMEAVQDVKAGTATKESLSLQAFDSASKAVRVATAATLMFGATTVGTELKDLIKWGPDGNPERPDKDPEQKVLDVLDTSGMLGHLASIKHGFDADRYNQDPVYSWLGPAPSTALKVAQGAFSEMGGERGALQDALAKEAANFTRLPLPFEIMWSLASPDGTEAWRKDFRDWMAAPEIAPEEFDPYQVVPEFVKPYVNDWDPIRSVRDMFFPDKTIEELLNMDDDAREKDILMRRYNEKGWDDEDRRIARDQFNKRFMATQPPIEDINSGN